MSVRPELLPLLVLVPLLMAAAAWLYVRRRRRVAEALGERALVGRLAGVDLHRVPRRRLALLLAAAVALGVATTDPRWGMAAHPTELRGIDLVFVLDASNSMLTEDVAPNRLEQQREAARRIVDALEGARVGVVVFAGRAYILSPPTPDRGAVEMYLDALGPEIVPQTGSSLAAGLRQATNLLAGAAAQGVAPVLLLMSEGEAHEERDAVLEAAQRAGRAGVTVYTLGIGTASGGPVPDIDLETGERLGYKVDPETGEVALSQLDEQLLRETASAGRGAYYHLGERDALDRLLADVQAQARGRPARAGERDHRGEREPRYDWFVGLALLLLAMEVVVERRGHRRTGE